MADPDEDGDIDEYLRRSAAAERPPLGDEERSARAERQYAAQRAARNLWGRIVKALQGGPCAS